MRFLEYAINDKAETCLFVCSDFTQYGKHARTGRESQCVERYFETSLSFKVTSQLAKKITSGQLKRCTFVNQMVGVSGVARLQSGHIP